jgi:hypothetical protein
MKRILVREGETMNITPEEAQSALNDIQHATKVARTVFNFWAYHMLIWGCAWTLGFLASQFWPRWINWIWLVMVVGGVMGSAIIGIMQGRRVRLAPGSHLAFVSSRLGIFYGVLYCFTILWMIIFPLSALEVGMLWITVVMFGYIIAGVWLQQPLFIGLGAGVTVMSVAGYYLLPHYFWLWSAVFAGLPLIVGGVYSLRQR